MKEREIKKVAFFGVSGSGKTTTTEYLKNEGELFLPDFKVIVANVAEPLHLIQSYAYEQFGIPNTGQDGAFLQFVARHFEDHLGMAYIKHVNRLIENENGDRNILVVNGDVRNNAYEALRDANFVFVRIFSHPDDLRERLDKRGDISKYNTSDAVEWVDQIHHDFVLENTGNVDDLKLNIRNLMEEIVGK